MQSWKQILPWVVLALMAAVAWLGLSRITFDVDVLAMLPDSAEARGLSNFQNHFGARQGLLLTIETENPDTTERLAEKIAGALEKRDDLVSKVVWSDPLEEEGAAADLVAFAWLNANPNDVSAMIRNFDPDRSPETIQKTMDAINDAAFVDQSVMMDSYDPFGLLNVPGLDRHPQRNSHSFATSTDGRFRLLSVLPAPAYTNGNYRIFTKWLDEIRATVHPITEPSLAETGFTGEPAFLSEIGSGMEHDMKNSPIMTAVLVGLLFFLMFRRYIPLLVLFFLVTLSALAALGFGGIFFGSLSVMSAGFAAIVIGLVIDYGVVLWCESRTDSQEARTSARKSVIWSALTTAAVFLAFNLSSYPGIAELGTLVAAGVILGAVVMLVSPLNRKTRSKDTPQAQNSPPNSNPPRPFALAITGILTLVAMATLIGKGMPKFDAKSKPFELRGSPATLTMKKIEHRLWSSNNTDIKPFVVWGRTDNLSEDKRAAEQALQSAFGGEPSKTPQLPFVLVPDLENQQATIPTIKGILDYLPRLESELLAAGFTEEAGSLLRDCVTRWKQAAAQIEAGKTYHPQNDSARWMWHNFYSVRDNQWCLAGTAPNIEAPITHLHESTGMGAADWDKVARNLQSQLNSDLARVGGLSLLMLCTTLILAYRRCFELLLSLAAMALSGLLLMGLTSLSGIPWTGFSLFSLPILLGTGIDYAFHMTFALRSDPGNFTVAARRMQKALVFCAGSSAIAFGSLTLSKIQGLASLGTVCALGILVNLVVMAWLLPAWWCLFQNRSRANLLGAGKT